MALRRMSLPSLNPGQIKYVMQKLVQERKLSSADLSRYLDEMKAEIRQLEDRLASLREAADEAREAQAPAAQAARVAAPAPRPRRRRGRGGRPAAAAAGRKAAKAPAKAAAPVKTSARGKTPITKAQLTSRKLQGQYLGLLIQFPKERRAAYQKISKDQGREAAITKMRTDLKK